MRPSMFMSVIALIVFSFSHVHAQDVTTMQATSSDISENLDLEAVAIIFAEAEDLADFEKRLNDPEVRISNLDLNSDGYVDYLRVIETSNANTHVVVIQAVLDKDVYQDVATIDVEKDNTGNIRVQVIGDVYMYGPNYIIEPYYMYPPTLYLWFWGPLYRSWYSPYYWGYYPPYYSPWNPYPVYVYIEHVHVHVNRHPNTTYGYVGHRTSTASIALEQSVTRNDHAIKNPEKTFVKRNEGIANKKELIIQQERSSFPVSTKPVQENWKPATENNIDRKAVTPADRQSERQIDKNIQQQTPQPRNTIDQKQYDQPAPRPKTNEVPKQSVRPSRATPSKPATREATSPSKNASTPAKQPRSKKLRRP